MEDILQELQANDWLLDQMEYIQPTREYQVGKEPGIVHDQRVVKVEQPQGVIPARGPRPELSDAYVSGLKTPAHSVNLWKLTDVSQHVSCS